MPKRSTRGRIAVVRGVFYLSGDLDSVAFGKNIDFDEKNGMVPAALVKVTVRSVSNTDSLDPNAPQGIVPRRVDSQASMCGRLGTTAHEPT
jgi:hypothetical protein